MDFLDDEHLAAAIAKNKQMLLGKKLSIARSNPKQSGKDGHGFPKEHGKLNGLNGIYSHSAYF